MNRITAEPMGGDAPISAGEIRALVRSDHVHRRAYSDPEIFALEQARIQAAGMALFGLGLGGGPFRTPAPQPAVQHRVSNTDEPTLCPLCGNTHGRGNLNVKTN